MADQRAHDDLNRLLDRYERNPGSGRHVLRIDVGSFTNQRALDRYLTALDEAARSGGLNVKARRGLRRNEPPMVSLGEPHALYAYLGRSPAAEEAARLQVQLTANRSEPWLLRAMSEIAESWSRRRDWYGIVPGDEEGVGRAAALAQAVVEGQHHGLDVSANFPAPFAVACPDA